MIGLVCDCGNYIMKKTNKKSKFVLTIGAIFACCFLLGNFSEAKSVNHTSPKKANYYLQWDLTESQARQLAKWDLVILDMEIQQRRPDLLIKMKTWNPDIVLLVYITPQEIKQNPAASYSQMRRRLVAGIADDWYLKNSSGNKLSWWPGTYLLNVTKETPRVSGQRFNDYLVDFVVDELLASGYWDGVFYDNAWDNISYFAGSNVDTNRDGQKDNLAWADQKWREGMSYIYNSTREKTNNKYLIVGNGFNDAYKNDLDGLMIENFSALSWTQAMAKYQDNSRAQNFTVVNNNTGNQGGQSNYQLMRFGLASSLLENGYYSFDYGDTDHGQLWWYDEYSVNLGNPISESISKNGYSNYVPDVWQRDFENGISIVNSTDRKQAISLGGEYEKIRGTQDTAVNDGSIVSELAVDAQDGQILLKTFASLNDVVFENGAFARFVRPDSSRVRNGFFVFEDGYKGGDKIARIDLDGNGQRDLLVASGNKIMAWRDDGQLFMRLWPYTVNYKGELKIAVGDLNGDNKMEVIVSPSDGYPAPVKIYTRHGRQMKPDWYPFGSRYSGGINIAIGNVNGGDWSEILVGVGNGLLPKVRVYDFTGFDFNLTREFPAFASAFRGGVNLAAGDVDGNGIDEIIVGAGPGKEPAVKVFSGAGQQIYREFNVYSAFNLPGIEVASADVDFDGKDDIIAFGEGF